MADMIKQKIGQIFNEIADSIESGNFGKKVRVGLTVIGSELGVEELVRGAELAAMREKDIEVVVIGDCKTKLENHPATTPEDCHKKMEELLNNKEIDGAVTFHYNFPLGVSTVGRVVAPATGKEMILSTTTGTSDTDRVNAMVKNTISGIAVAKSLGIAEPTVGILNIDGANPVARKLKKLQENGYQLKFTESSRADGGVTMRGNDLLKATPDIMITDSLTGNILMKLFSSFTTGGSYEAFGYGYGPGVGKDYKQIISIVSRASGAPVIANAIRYTASVCQGDLIAKFDQEIKAAKKAGLNELLTEVKKEVKQDEEEVKMPEKKIVSSDIPGVDILDIEDAKVSIWKEGIYAETGMGCTGPIVLVAKEDLERAREILKQNGYI